ncbi:hypothetical protein CSHISOI_09233, partial [Colletotrichum shisoi]
TGRGCGVRLDGTEYRSVRVELFPGGCLDQALWRETCAIIAAEQSTEHSVDRVCTTTVCHVAASHCCIRLRFGARAFAYLSSLQSRYKFRRCPQPGNSHRQVGRSFFSSPTFRE